MALEVSGKYIRVTIQHRGEKIRFKWPEPSCEASLRAAKRAQDRIKRDLEDGVFQRVEDYLPLQEKPGSFAALAKRWIKTSTASLATKNEYRKALNYYWLPELGDAEVSKLRPAIIKELIGEIDFPSGKTKNNALIPLRQVLHFAHEDEFTHKDLSAFVKGDKLQASPPDPLSQSEVERVLSAASDRFRPFFEFMFFSGLRVGEGIGLAWRSVDFNTSYVRIHESQTNGVHLDTTKTYKERDVKLHPRALSALTAMKAETFMLDQRVFMTEEQEPYITPKAQRKAWRAALKKAGIRYRPMKNTRHTYSTLLLMSGCSPYWVASQMGHSLQVLLGTYAKWLPGDQDDMEMARVTDMATDEKTESL